MKAIKHLFLVFCFLLAGCTSSNPAKSNHLKVVTTFYPLYDFAKKIGGDYVDVINLTPAGSEPHDFEPSTNDIKSLNESNVFIYQDESMEHWVSDVLESIPSKSLKVVKASENIKMLTNQKQQIDPHIWLSIPNAKQELLNIKNAFCSVDQSNCKYYENNYNMYAKKLDELYQKYQQKLQPFANQSILVSHPAFAYLCKDFHLKQVAIEGLSTSKDPSPSKMKEIIEFAKENKQKVIFYEASVDGKVAKTIADEAKLETMILNTLESLTKEQMDKGDDYFTLMEKNLENLIYAFSK